MDVVSLHNFKRTVSSNNLIVHCRARNSNLTAAKKKAKEFNGLDNNLFLTIGAKVMICSNLEVSLGLYNGTKGTVKSIIYGEN